MGTTQKALEKQFIRSMKRIARELNKEESEITKAQFVSHDAENISDWDLRKAGGFSNLKKLHFPDDAALDAKYGSKLISSHRNKLDKTYGQALFFEKELLTAVKETLAETPLIVHPPVKPLKNSKKAQRSIVAAISDTHFGANISKDELHGLNEFNWTVASRRLAHYIEQVVHYKMDHRKETDLVLQLNGDIIAGLIHNQEWFVDLLTTQFSGTINILAQAISFAAQHFPKVKVVCTTGNHGRNIGKADKGRAATHKWDSYEHMIYVSLKEILKSYSNVEFHIPEAPLAVYKVQGHNVVQTHGDTVINVGNPGKSLNMDGIANQINQLNSSDLLKPEEKAAVVCVGHVHVPTTQMLNNGCFLMINGCLSGIDPFAQSIGIFSNNPTQVIFESTDKYAVGDIRYIQVKSADSEKRFDEIIKPFKAKF
jgi:predicted phosphodiesterase